MSDGVLIGFSEQPEHLRLDRTNRHGLVAGATGIFQPEDVATAVTAARAFGFNEIAEALPHVAAMLGLAYTFYARWDDARRKLR